MATPVLPSKDTMERRLPNNVRNVVPIAYESPTYQAGTKLGDTAAGLGVALHKKDQEAQKQKEANKNKPADCAQLLCQALAACGAATRKIDIAPDPRNAGSIAFQQLDQTKTNLQAALQGQDVERYGPTIESIIESGKAQLQGRIEDLTRGMRVSEVQAQFPQLAAQHTVLSDPMQRQKLGSAAYESINRLVEAGDIDVSRAQEMKRELQVQLVRTDVMAQSPEWRIEHLRPGENGQTRWFRDVLGAEDADFLHAQAVQQDHSEKRDAGTQDLLQRFGSSAEGEEKALAEINARHDDPGFKPLYLAKLEAQRRQQRQDEALSARNAFALAVEGRESEIDPADRKRLHQAGQMAGVLDAAQLARSAPGKGELLFRERYLAMGEEERARFKPAELARKLAPQDFLEVMQGAGGDIDEGQRSRMQGFVQAVKPMLRSVTVGQCATAQEQERDRRFLGLVHDEVKTLVADEEKKLNGRTLTVVEYQGVLRQATDRALLRDELMEVEQRTASVADALYMDPEVA